MSERAGLHIRTSDGLYAVCRLAADAPWPAWLPAGGLCSATRTAEELSVVCLQHAVPEEVRSERDWRLLSLEGPFAFEQTGILLQVLRPLSDAGIGIFALSTFDTDHVLVKQPHLGAALQALAGAGLAID